MGDQRGISRAAGVADVPASIAIFQFDHVDFKLKDPKIICLPLAFPLQSTSDLWKTSMMKRNDQDAADLPLTSISLVREIADGGFRLMCPHGLKELEVMVDNVQLTQESVATGYPLRGGELVKLFCMRSTLVKQEIPDFGPVEFTLRNRVGPLVFQYHQQAACDPLHDRDEEVSSDQRTLDGLPDELLRLIFGLLPVDDALHTIPATCSWFLEAVKEDVAFTRWKISNGCLLTIQEAAFCQGWTAKSVSHLVLSKVPLLTEQNISRFSYFTYERMEPSRSSVISFEANLEFDVYDCIPGKQHIHQFSACSDVCHTLRYLPALKHVKLRGFPTHMITMIGRGVPLPNVERVWVGCKGKDLDKIWQEECTRPRLPKLRRITLGFSWEREPAPAETPEKLENIFSEFSRVQETNIERILILESTGASWKMCQIMLAGLKRLEGLSLTIDAHLTDDEMRSLIQSIPKSVKFLKITTSMSLTDDWCLAVATGCTNLEMFCCYGPEVTAGGVGPFVIACERLTKLFLLRDENGVRVAREDILPDQLKKGVRVYERELSRIFD